MKRSAVNAADLFGLSSNMTFFTYIIESESTGKFYIGHTDNLDRRLAQHNDPLYHGSKTTKKFPGPWKLVYQESYISRSEAVVRERQLKSWKNRGAIQKLISSGR